MGQYHRLANLDKKQILNPYAFSDGAKLREWSGSRMSEGLVLLLAVSNGRGGGDYDTESPLAGSWAGDRIAVIGDYWGDGDDDVDKIPTWENMEADEFEDISEKVVEVMCQADPWFKESLLDSVAVYDWGKDWSKLFTDEELANAKIKLEKERRNGL